MVMDVILLHERFIILSYLLEFSSELFTIIYNVKTFQIIKSRIYNIKILFDMNREMKMMNFNLT